MSGSASLCDDPALDTLRDMVGVEQPVVGWNTSATADGVRHFARGYGDDNPAWGESAVPPSFLYSVCSGGRAPGHAGPAEILSGTAALWLSDAWTYHAPLALGASLTSTVAVKAVSSTVTRSRGPVVIIDELFRFCDGHGEPVADYTKQTMRFRRPGSSRQGDLGVGETPWDGPRYTRSELDRIGEAVLAERDRRRGALPRPASSVRLNDDLGTLIKGPLSLTSIVAWVAGWGSAYLESDRLAHARWREDPALLLTVPSTGRPESVEAPHWDPELAHVAGMPRSYDFGAQRMAWLLHLVTDWAGDAGEVLEFEGRLTRPNLLGDLTTVTGCVEEIRDGTVSCRVAAHNQRNEQTAAARVTVRLPDIEEPRN